MASPAASMVAHQGGGGPIQAAVDHYVTLCENQSATNVVTMLSKDKTGDMPQLRLRATQATKDMMQDIEVNISHGFMMRLTTERRNTPSSNQKGALGHLPITYETATHTAQTSKRQFGIRARAETGIVIDEGSEDEAMSFKTSNKKRRYEETTSMNHSISSSSKRHRQTERMIKRIEDIDEAFIFEYTYKTSLLWILYCKQCHFNMTGGTLKQAEKYNKSKKVGAKEGLECQPRREDVPSYDPLSSVSNLEVFALPTSYELLPESVSRNLKARSRREKAQDPLSKSSSPPPPNRPSEPPSSTRYTRRQCQHGDPFCKLAATISISANRIPLRLFRHTRASKIQSPSQASTTGATKRPTSLSRVLTLAQIALTETAPIVSPPIRIPYPAPRTLTLPFPTGPAWTKSQSHKSETRDATQRPVHVHKSAAPGGRTAGGLVSWRYVPE
ncbi:hypothetical protein F5B22DRAFT_643705 [Xylaria bambusicola]|uniref:uncharacterized protein n=1 Tax=Xylaria bambusicola TaxID=326684 RepID=UPI00200885CB|nr:uncharacterized protein F5B22DRAFT_643705 [Xylaria bambusicola]KAI0521537.1 hypothetical protein F5B22DRAFT_643705 [Xylaria bambusicola]